MSPQSAFAAYREYIASVSPPCVPMLAVYLSDLTLVDENVDLVFGLVNLDKLRLVYEIISRVQLYQHEAYSTIMRVEPLAAYLECLPRWSEDELYDISLALEPRDAAPPQQAGPSPSKNRDSVSKSDKDRGPRPGPIIATLTQNRTKRSGSKRTLVISGSGSSSSLDRTSKGPETPRTSIGRKPSFLYAVFTFTLLLETHLTCQVERREPEQRGLIVSGCVSGCVEPVTAAFQRFAHVFVRLAVAPC